MPNRKLYKTNEEYNAYFREYRKRNIEKSRKYVREFMKAWRKRTGIYHTNDWEKKNPEKRSAQRMAQAA